MKKNLIIQKLQEKIDKIFSQTINTELYQDLNKIVDRYQKKELTKKNANQLISNRFSKYKVVQIAKKIASKFNITLDEAILKYITDNENKKFNKFKPKKLKILNEEKNIDEIEKTMKKIKIKFLPKSEFFMIRITVYKGGTSKNPANNIFYHGEYKRVSNGVYSFHVELQLNKYNDNEILYLTAHDLKFLDDILLYYENINNENADAYHLLSNLISNGGMLIIVEFTKVNDQINNNENVSDIVNYGNYVDKKDFVIYNKFINIKMNEDNNFLPIYNNDYINNNYKTLSCLMNIILEYKDCFEGKLNKGYRLFKSQPEFTYEGIRKFLYGDIIDDVNDYGATLKVCEKFFEFGINVRVYDIYLKEIYRFKTDKKNNSITPNKLYLIYHNNHIQKIDNRKEFSHIIEHLQNKNKLKLISLEKINYNCSVFEYNDHIIIKNTQDIFDNIDFKLNEKINDDDNKLKVKKNKNDKVNKKINDDKENEKTSNNNITILFINFSILNNILFDLIKINGIIPQIKTNSTNVVHISFEFRKSIMIELKLKEYIIKVNIKSHITDHVLEPIKTVDKLIKFQALNNSIKEKLVNYKYLSTYNDNTFNFISYYRPKPLICKLDEKILFNVKQIDISKAYPSQLLKIKKVPIFTLFNYPKKYNNQIIDDYNMYLIKLYENNCIFKEKYTIIYGYNLKQINLKLKIIQVLEYSYLVDIDTSTILDECFDIEDDLYITEEYDSPYWGLSKRDILKKSDFIDEKDRKQIINQQIGSLGKIKSKKEVSSVSFDEEDAQRKLTNHGGFYYKIKNDYNEEILYFHVKKTVKRYKNGFLPFHMMIYDNMRIILNNIKNDMESNNIKLYGIKCDAIYFTDFTNNYKKILEKYEIAEYNKTEYYEVDKYKNISNVRKNIGKLTYQCNINEFDTVHGLPLYDGKIYKKFENYRYDNKMNKIIVKDEYNINDEIINNLIIISQYPGSGKSYAIKQYLIKNELKGLFIINNNNLAIEIKKEGFDSITPYVLLGCNINKDDFENKNDYKFDIEQYDVIIFEEIFFNDFNILQKLYDFMLNNNDKMFLANGDSAQLECCRELITLNKKIECVNIMFPNYIDLKIIKRCDAQQLYIIKEYIEENKDDLTDNEIIKYIINKYFKNKLIKDTNNIKIGLSYTNETKTIFNQKIHKKKYNHTNFIIGQKVIAKDHFKINKNLKLYRNYEYVITNIKNNIIYFKDEFTGNEFDFEIKLFNKYLDHPYIKTVHSAQGTTIKDKFIIYDWKFNFVNIKWFWTAITRCSNFDNIYIYDGDDNKHQMKYDVSIVSYKFQDKSRNMTYKESEYINYNWISEQLIKQKYICNICNDVINNLSIDRIQNSIAHIKSNCQCVCLQCNRSK